MLKSRLILPACGAAILGVVSTVSLHANDARHTTYLTFSAPVALPGVALPAGTYIFEHPIPEAGGNLVRVKSADGAHVYLTAFTRIVERPARLKSALHVLFAEVPRGMTPPIKVWYPAGASTGNEFIYPKNSRQLGLDD